MKKIQYEVKLFLTKYYKIIRIRLPNTTAPADIKRFQNRD